VQLSDITVPFTLLNNPDGTGAAGGEWHVGGRTEYMSFFVKYEDLEEFCSQVAGVPTSFGTGTGAIITQQVPLQHPRVKRLYACQIEHKEATSDEFVTTSRPFAACQVTVTFKAFEYDPGNGDTPWIKIQAQGSSDMITLPGVPFAFSTGEKIEQDIGRIVGQVAFQLTRFQIPDFDQWCSVAIPLMGYVNSSALTISKTTFAAGLVLFPTFDLSSQTNFLGSPQTQVTFPIVYRTLNWNYGMRSDGVYDAITPSPYPTADLSALLK
jgi:hypothetical protein